MFCFRATFLVAAQLFRLKTFAQNPPDPDSCCQMLNEMVDLLCSSNGGEICRIICRTKARPCEEIVGEAPTHPTREAKYALIALETHICLLQSNQFPSFGHPRRISYFLRWRECYSYFSAAPARFAPTQSPGLTSGEIYFFF